jgi:hypothetical protein
MADESAQMNAMDPWLSSSIGSGVRGPITTIQPNGRILRRPQSAKYFCYINSFEPLLTGAAGISVRDAFQIDGDADFWIFEQAVLAFTEAGAVQRDDTVGFEVSPVSEAYQFQPLFLANYGSGRFPNRLSPPIILPRTAIWQAVANSRNLAVLPTFIFIAHHGAKVYRTPFQKSRMYERQKFYDYPANFTANDGGVGTIPAGQTSIATVRIDGGSDFDVRKLTLVADGPCTIQVKSDDDNWFQRPLRGELIGQSLIAAPSATQGSFSGELPFWLPVPRFVTKAAYLNAQITNLDLVNAIRVQLVFHGNRLYPGGGL